MIVVIQSWLSHSFRYVPSTHASSSYELLDDRKIYAIFIFVAIAFADFRQSHSGRYNRPRISLDLPATVNSAGLFRLAERFATVFLIRWFKDIGNKAVGHFKRKCELVVILAAQQFCWQSDSYRLQSPAMPLPTAAMPPCLRKFLAKNIHRLI